MIALPVSSRVQPSPDFASQQANAWIARHHGELVSRANACFARLPEDRREEAIAETVALALTWALSAAKRGKLHRMTAYWAVVFAARQFRVGRRFGRNNSSCVMSDAARIRHGIQVGSLDDEVGTRRGRPLVLRECLADHDAENPYDIVRRENDYQDIFEMEDVSPKAVATFQYLADTKCEGKQCDLADELGVSEGRITQLKDEVAGALSRHGYTAQLRRRPSAQGV